MKRFILFVLCMSSILAGCSEMKQDIEDLKARIGALEGTTISSINQQISSINTSLSNLNAMDGSLKEYIQALQERADNLQKQCDSLQKQSNELQKESNELQAITAEIPAINEAVEGLKAKDESLQNSIASLKSFQDSLSAVVAIINSSVDDKLTKEREWVKATFCTLENYQSTVSEIAELKTGIDDINKGLVSRIGQIDACLDSLGDALSSKIADTESRMKNWVNESLTGYYDIATMDAKLKSLASSAEAGQDSLRTEIEALSGKIDDAFAELTTAYQKAISEAIESNNGIISNKIATEINAVQTSLEKKIKDLGDDLSRLDARVTALETIVAGLRVSSTPYGMVVVREPADTISKGGSFDALLRVNPSGVPMKKDMISLDCVSSKQFFPKAPVTKASYIKSSDHFSLSNFAADKDASGTALEGQYVLSMASSAKEAVWDDSNLAYVGAYKDANGKIQYISTPAYKTVMMPLPSEGLSTWYYPNASFLIHQKVTEDDLTYVIDTLGVISFALDGMQFVTADGKEKRVYSGDFIDSVSFVPASGSAPVFTRFERDLHVVSFYPDTTGSEIWRQFQDSTGIKRQDVKGKIVLFDRWGGSSSFDMEMAWFNTTTFDYQVYANKSDLDPEDPFVLVDMAPFLKEVGYDESLFEKRRTFSSDVMMTNLDDDVCFEPKYMKDSRTLKLEIYGDTEPGKSYSQHLILSLGVSPSDVNKQYSPKQISLEYNIVLNIR